MKRGVVTLTRDEFNQLLTVLDITKYQGTQLYEKLKSASESNIPEAKILLSADEAETVIDEVGPPIFDDQVINSGIQKINNLLVSFSE
jgi:hypothetical protein